MKLKLLDAGVALLRERFPRFNAFMSRTDEVGSRATPENEMKYLYRTLWVDPELRQSILDIREFDRLDGRVKKIHGRVARDVIKGGLVLQQVEQNDAIAKLWKAYGSRLQLHRPEKLKSDARALIMEGNLPMQWVLDDPARADPDIVAAIRMPSETIYPDVTQHGRFKDVRRAYLQLDVMTGAVLAEFPMWKLHLCRLDPDNYDDHGSLGRPFLDASRTFLRKLQMTEEDLVIRRRMRAPLRMVHVREGASKEDLEAERDRVEKDAREIITDYWTNKKGTTTAIQGDENLDQINDVVHLLDSFFSGAPLPKGMMGYTDGLARDILEDLKRDYFDEIDSLQDTQAFAYEAGFRLQLLLKGINPDAEEFTISFSERRTETPTQTVDRALKLQALGLPQGMVWEELGYNAEDVRRRREYEAEHYDPYPGEDGDDVPPGTPRVKITPGNGRKGESGTTIKNRGQ